MRILEQLVPQAMTMSQLGELFGETTAKMHYHVHALEKAGFIRLVEKRERGGFIEKYYRAVAKEVKVSAELLRTSPASELSRTVQQYFETLGRDVLRAALAESENPDGANCFTMTDETLWLSGQEYQELNRRLADLLKPYRQPRGRADEERWGVHWIAHKEVPQTEEELVDRRDEERP
jgi:predicted ArsR family transcriptional regulator